MRRRVVMIMPVVILVGLIVFRLVERRLELRAQPAQRAARLHAAPAVSVAPVRVQDLVTTYEGVGSVDAPLSVRISAQVTGRVDYLQVHEGDRIHQDEVLIRIDPTEVEAQVRQARGH